MKVLWTKVSALRDCDTFVQWRRADVFGVIAVRTAKSGAFMITLNINGQSRKLDVPDDMPLLWILRDVLGMTGTKFGCGQGLCGACTIHIGGQPTRSCITPVSAAAGKRVTTIEAIGVTSAGKKVQAAWRALDVPQCGYCQSGQIMSASALLAAKPRPSDSDIDDAMAGNICRCGTYTRIRAAIKQAAGVAEAGVPGAAARKGA
jgi:isoquinoline 1-oxidoreductase alpha subunit